MFYNNNSKCIKNLYLLDTNNSVQNYYRDKSDNYNIVAKNRSIIFMAHKNFNEIEFWHFDDNRNEDIFGIYI